MFDGWMEGIIKPSAPGSAVKWNKLEIYTFINMAKEGILKTHGQLKEAGILNDILGKRQPLISAPLIMTIYRHKLWM